MMRPASVRAAAVAPWTRSGRSASSGSQTSSRPSNSSTLGIRVLGRPVLGEGALRAFDEALDRVGEVDRRDVVVAALDTEPVGLEQHVGVGVAGRRVEAVGGELNEQAEGVGE